MVTKKFCDLCNNEIKDEWEMYSLKLYRSYQWIDGIFAKHICKDCYNKIIKYTDKIKCKI